MLSFVLPSGAAQAARAGGKQLEDSRAVKLQHVFSKAEVPQLDVTDSARGRAALARAAKEGVPTDSEPYTVYAVEDSVVTVPTDTQVAVVRGLTAAGEAKTDIVPSATPVNSPASGGLAVPPKAAWAFNVDGSWIKEIGDNWIRKGIWTITNANNWKTCSTCASHDYYRLYYRVQGGLESASAGVGFRRLWVELNRGNNGVSVTHFEEGKPQESYAGSNNVTTTIGFGTSNSISLGYGPITAGGGTSTSYSGSMSSSSENWHPVFRSEVGSGGVQWCRYGADFRGTKLVTTRVADRTGGSVTNPPGWELLDGMAESAANCPAAL